METQRIAMNSPEPLMGFLIPLGQLKGVSLNAARGSSDLTAISVGEYLLVGRDESCDLIIKDPFVSARHARIERRASGYLIRDLHSKNGSVLNGSRVGEAVLGQNDRLRFGESTFVFSEAPGDGAAMSSKNQKWNQQLKRLPAFAATDFPVLICGPSGTGKEILAREIHARSKHSQGPFVGINCSALSETLIESELFGHVKGSFTGALHDRKGAFETARAGTLFLDEIGDLPLSLQPKLLRALENNEIRPVGSDRTVATDVRILAATHKNLSLQAMQGRFREDLYYRLNVCQLTPPALTQRLEDFDDLLYQFAKTYRVRFSFQAVVRLKQHPWPGNIRELKNLVARVSAYFPGKHIQSEDLSAVLDLPLIATEPAPLPSEREAPNVALSVIKEFEREMIVRRLIANQGNQRRTALDLGMPKSTLHDRIRAYSIDLKAIARQEESID